MDDLMATLVERDSTENWPPTDRGAAQVRARATRRRNVRRFATATAVAVSAAAVVMGVALVQRDSTAGLVGPADHSHQRTHRPVRPDGPTATLLGVTVTLPDGWSSWYESSAGDARYVCLGPATDEQNCPVVLLVNPAAAGSDVPEHPLMTGFCRPGTIGPRGEGLPPSAHPTGLYYSQLCPGPLPLSPEGDFAVDLPEHGARGICPVETVPTSDSPAPLDWGGPPALWYETRCSYMTFVDYLLADNTVTISTIAPPENKYARSIFESLQLPVGWPS